MIDKIISLIHTHQNFVITTHLRPDGDAVGSELGLGRLLRKLDKTVSIINSDPLAYNLAWLPGVSEVEVFDGSLSQRERIAGADVIFVVDTNGIERIGKPGMAIRNSPAVKVLIDHHPAPEAWFDVAYRRETASSTGELVYEIIDKIDPGLIDAEIATALYTAIMTDTGSFRYSSVNARVHRIVADLLERGDIQPTPIHTAIFDTRTVEGLRLLSRTLGTLTLRYRGRVGYMVVTQEALRETGADVSETEGFVNYALSIEGVDVALLFTETERGTKVSFRSKGLAFVHEWAQLFGGGGHRNASGAFVRRPLEETIRAVISAAPRFLDLEDETKPERDELSSEDAAYLSSILEMQSKK